MKNRFVTADGPAMGQCRFPKAGEIRKAAGNAALSALPALGLLLWMSAAWLPAAAAQTGEKAPNFVLRDTEGNEHALSRYAGRIVVLEFWSFKCPVTLAYGERMTALQEKYQRSGVVILSVASNRNESPQEIKRNVENLKIRRPVLIDTDGGLAERLGVTHAPSIFILDGQGVLRYRGSLDNNKEPGERGRRAFAEEAIDALLAGRAVAQPETREFGCTIRNNMR